MVRIDKMGFKPSTLLILVLLSLSLRAGAQSASSSTVLGTPDSESKSWSARVDYDLGTDYSEAVRPRVVVNRLSLGLSYDWGNFFKTSAGLDIKAATVNGQIYKDKQQSYGEVLGWRPSLGVSYGKPFWEQHRWTVSSSFYLPIDELTRLEGYQGVIRIGARASLRFWNDRYAMDHRAGLSNVLNSYRFNTLGTINPDYFFTYEWDNSLRLIGKLSFDFSFGFKLTRYLDQSQLYSYNNSIGLSYEWRNLFPFVSYENGGFTEDGKVDAWFIDRYRRILSAGVSATF